MKGAPETSQLLGLWPVFVLLFVTLGPIKILGPFTQLTRDADQSEVKKIAIRTFALALIAAVAGGFVGQFLAKNWEISLAALTLAGGIIFLLVGLSLVLEQYKPVHATPAPLPEAAMPAALRVVFPIVVTPYGIAALIALLANSPDVARTAAIVVILILVMALNFAAMLYARRIMGGVFVLALHIFGAVLGVLQVGLAVQMILHGLRDLGVL